MTLKVVWCDFVVISVDLLPCGDPWSLVVYSIGGDQFCAVWRLVVVHGSYICICDTHTHIHLYITVQPETISCPTASSHELKDICKPLLCVR